MLKSLTGPFFHETARMVMGPERLEPKINCIANLRSVLSLESVPGIKNQEIFRAIERTNVVVGSTGGHDIKTDWPTDRRP
jgi:hypothetical protein